MPGSAVVAMETLLVVKSYTCPLRLTALSLPVMLGIVYRCLRENRSTRGELLPHRKLLSSHRQAMTPSAVIIIPGHRFLGQITHHRGIVQVIHHLLGLQTVFQRKVRIRMLAPLHCIVVISSRHCFLISAAVGYLPLPIALPPLLDCRH